MADDLNPFDAEDMLQAEQPSIGERARLNMTDSFYRGSLVGSAGMFARKTLADDPNSDPAAREKAKKDYGVILNDLARYDLMRDYDGPLEMSAAFAGQMFGGALSPESWIAKVPGAGKLFGPLIEKPLGRFGEQAVSQAAVQGATDPAVQALSIGAGTQEKYEPARTVASVALGGALGAALHIPSEIARAKTPKPKISAEEAGLAAKSEAVKADAARIAASIDDPSLRAEADEIPAKPEIKEEAPVPVEIDRAPEPEPVAVEGEGSAAAVPESVTPDFGMRDLVRDRLESSGAKKVDVNQGDHFDAMTDWEGDVPVTDLVIDSTGQIWDLTPAQNTLEMGFSVLRDAEDISGQLQVQVSHDANGKPMISAKLIGDNVTPEQNESLGILADKFNIPREKLKPYDYFGLSAVRSDAPEQFQIAVQEPQTLVNFLKAEGLKDFKGELKAADINKRFPGLVRKNGMELDKAREAAAEAGYLPADSTPDDLIQAILSDEPVYAQRDLDQAAEYKAQKQTKEHLDAIAAARKEMDAFAPGDALNGEAARLMVEQDLSPEDALAMAAEAGPRLSEAEMRAMTQDAALVGDIQFRKRTKPGESVPHKPPGEVAAPSAAAPNEGQLLSLQEQGARLAEEIGHPLRQGRVQGGKEAQGQFDVRQGVVRVKNVADFETIAHEAGHYIERKLGDDFRKLLEKHDLELVYLDYEPNRFDLSEGFAEYARQYLTSPQAAAKAAPGFTREFEAYLAEKVPAMLESLQASRAAYSAWEAAPSGARLDAMVKTQKQDGVIARIRKDGFAPTVSNVLGKVYEGIFDDKATVTRAVRDLARMARDASGVKLSLEGVDNPEALSRLFTRSHQAGVRDMMDGVRPYHSITPEGPSLRDAIIKATGTPGLFGNWDEAKVKDFSNYLAARRIEYLWAKKDAGILERRPAAMTKGDAAEAIRMAEEANPTYADAAQMVHDYTRQILRKMFDGGLIERETYDALEKEGFYVPLYRDMGDKPLTQGGPTTGGQTRTEGPGAAQLIKRQRGSDRDIIDPLQSIMTQTFLVNRTLAHNDMVKSFVDVARAAQKAGAVDTGRIVEEVPAKQLIGQSFNLAETVRAAAKQNGIDDMDAKVLLGGIADLFGEDPVMATVFRQEPTGKRGEPIVFYKDGGVLKAVRLASGEEGMALYEAMTALPASMRDWAVTLGSASATMLRAGVTSSPEFALANFIRDQMAVGVLRADYLPFWDGLRGVGKELAQGETAQQFTAAGGMAAGAGRSGLSELIDGDINQLARKGWAVQRLGELSDIRKGDFRQAFKAFGEAVGVTESGTRLAVYEKVFRQKKEQGLSDYSAMLEAAFQSTDLLDFSRHGSGTEFIRKLVPFLNAHLQGLDKARRTIIEPLYRAAVGDVVTVQEQEAVKNAGLALFKLAGVGGALGYAYGLWAQRHQAYQDSSDRLRATHLVVPGAVAGKDGKILIVPKPFELAIGFNLGEALAAATAGDPRAARFALDGAFEVLAPPNVLDSIPIVKNWAELKLNRSFFTGRDIVPPNLQRLREEEQYTPRTSALAKAISKKIGVSPIKVDYAIGQQFGSLGRNILSLSNSFDPDAPVAAMEDAVISRRFIKSAFNGSEADKRYWELASQTNGEYATAKATYENMLGGFRDKEAMAFLAGLPEGQRAYVALNSDVDENGKSLHNAEAKSLHPVTRAAKAVTLINEYSRSLMSDTQISYATGERKPMAPDKRRNVLDVLNALKAMEQQNALILTKEPGYAGRRLQNIEKQFEILQLTAQDVADEIATRYATAKIAPMATVERVWPEMSKRLLSDGNKADLRDLVADARSDGFAFRGEKVKKPTKRRVPMEMAVP